jgi:hypothetical protein
VQKPSYRSFSSRVKRTESERHDGYDRPGQVYEARGQNKDAAECYRKVIEFIHAHPDDYNDPDFEAVFHRLVTKLDPPRPTDCPRFSGGLNTLEEGPGPTSTTNRDQNSAWRPHLNSARSILEQLGDEKLELPWTQVVHEVRLTH